MDLSPHTVAANVVFKMKINRFLDVSIFKKYGNRATKRCWDTRSTWIQDAWGAKLPTPVPFKALIWNGRLCYRYIINTFKGKIREHKYQRVGCLGKVRKRMGVNLDVTRASAGLMSHLFIPTVSPSAVGWSCPKLLGNMSMNTMKHYFTGSNWWPS